MKIAILTFSNAINRGAHMQCYALSAILKKMGHDVIVIQTILPKNKNISLKGKLADTILNIKNSKFRKHYYPNLTKPYHSESELLANPPVVDVYIVGSDQVWNPEITSQFGSKAFFLNFAPNNAIKIAYAASFGEDEWQPLADDEQIGYLMNSFQAVSVRENSGIRICKEHFHINNVELVLDPVFLLDNYNNFVSIKRNLKENIICYPLCDNEVTRQVFDIIVSETKMKPVSYNRHFQGQKKALSSISSWLNEIYNAKFIVTNSFHCMAFCIIFGKNFIATKPSINKESRIITTLSMLGLQTRYVDNLDDFNNRKEELLSQIDYLPVNKKLEVLRTRSLSFLKDSLSRLLFH